MEIKIILHKKILFRQEKRESYIGFFFNLQCIYLLWIHSARPNNKQGSVYWIFHWLQYAIRTKHPEKWETNKNDFFCMTICQHLGRGLSCQAQCNISGKSTIFSGLGISWFLLIFLFQTSSERNNTRTPMMWLLKQQEAEGSFYKVSTNVSRNYVNTTKIIWLLKEI